MSKQFSDIIKLGSLSLKNRIVMAAMTRCRTNPADGIPNNLLLQYYTQRTGAGLILTECLAVSQRGIGFPGAANLYNNDHV